MVTAQPALRPVSCVHGRTTFAYNAKQPSTILVCLNSMKFSHIGMDSEATKVKLGDCENTIFLLTLNLHRRLRLGTLGARMQFFYTQVSSPAKT